MGCFLSCSDGSSRFHITRSFTLRWLVRFFLSTNLQELFRLLIGGCICSNESEASKPPPKQQPPPVSSPSEVIVDSKNDTTILKQLILDNKLSLDYKGICNFLFFFFAHFIVSELALSDTLGSGAMGTVHKATFRGQTVAVKTFSADVEGQDLNREIGLLANLPRHENIVVWFIYLFISFFFFFSFFETVVIHCMFRHWLELLWILLVWWRNLSSLDRCVMCTRTLLLNSLLVSFIKHFK